MDSKKPWFGFNPAQITARDSFYWAISAPNFDSKWKSYSVLGLDGFDVKYGDMELFKKAGKKTVCYISAHWESWRPDADSFPPEILGRDLGDWKGERIVDIRRWNKLEQIFDKRILMCKHKGFDAIEFDNIDQRARAVSLLDVTLFVKRLVALSGKHGLPVFQKNMPHHVEQFESIMAGAIVESCNVWDECPYFEPYFQKNKPVWMIEYSTKHCKGKYFGKTYYANKILDGSKWRECK